MTRRTASGVLLLIATVFLAVPLAAQRAVPFLSARVVDEAAIVPDEVEARLEHKLAAFEAETGNQVAVLTVASLEGDAIEDFSLRVAETWELGRGGVDDGVLFVVARDDRRMRIEVGYGLEPELTDLESGRILDEIVAPHFRQGDFGAGIEAGVDTILASLEGAELPPPVATSVGSGEIFGRLVGMAIFFFVVGTFSLAAITGPGRAPWILYLFLTPFWLLFPTFLVHPSVGVFALTGWLVGFPLLRLLARKRGWDKKWFRESGSRRYHGGGWRSSGGFGGGGFSGGGFSGGGGSFGGGGSSGSW